MVDGGAPNSAVIRLFSLTLLVTWDNDPKMSLQKECKAGQHQNMTCQCLVTPVTGWVHIFTDFSKPDLNKNVYGG